MVNSYFNDKNCFLEISKVKSNDIFSINQNENPPKISIVIPTFRRVEMLRQALQSALDQEDYHNYEILIIDNDPSSQAEILGLFDFSNFKTPFRYIVNEENIGMFGNWNRGTELARGEWVTLLHDDDWLSPDFLGKITCLLTDETTLAACKVDAGAKDYNPYAFFDNPQGGAIVYELSSLNYVHGNITPAPGIVFKRELLFTIGGFNADYYPCSDYVAYVRISLMGRAFLLANKLAYYRIADNETFKGDTLKNMVVVSSRFKKELLSKESNVSSRLAYIHSMAYWFRLLHLYKINLREVCIGGEDKISYFLSKSNFLFRLFGFLLDRLLLRSKC